MFQDIDPHRITYEPGREQPREGDRVVFLKQGLVLLGTDAGALALPEYGQARRALGEATRGLIYMFSVDGAGYHYSPDPAEPFARFAYDRIGVVRSLGPPLPAFAAATAFHIASWYGNNRYCGQCAGPMLPKAGERALHCPVCGLVKYPRISPVVIVGVRDGERLLLARAAKGEYKGYGLVSGFVEPGETLEAALAREVMEETGLTVAGARYYKSQPWAFSESLLMGFFADLRGGGAVRLDSGELSEARWFSREELPADESRFSLTWDMIQAFRNGEV